jgi:hypothetical protein
MMSIWEPERVPILRAKKFIYQKNYTRLKIHFAPNKIKDTFQFDPEKIYMYDFRVSIMKYF